MSISFSAKRELLGSRVLSLKLVSQTVSMRFPRENENAFESELNSLNSFDSKADNLVFRKQHLEYPKTLNGEILFVNSSARFILECSICAACLHIEMNGKSRKRKSNRISFLAFFECSPVVVWEIPEVS